MPDHTRTEQETLAAQAEMFRLADSEHGLSMSVLARETGVSLETLKSYNRSNIFARAKMPLPVFVKLLRVIPDDCTSVITSIANKVITSSESDDGDFDALGREAAGFVSEMLDAEADGKIDHIETARLKRRAARMAPLTQKVART